MLDAEHRSIIDKCEFYMALITPKFFKDKLAMDQAAYANLKRKPSIIVIINSADLDHAIDMLRDCEIIDPIFIDDKDDMINEAFAKRIYDDMINARSRMKSEKQHKIKIE